MSESTTAISYPVAATGALNSSIAPCQDPLFADQHTLVVESGLGAARGILGRTDGFAPVTGSRIRSGPGITQQTLRSGLNSETLQLDADAVIPGFGTDLAMAVARCVQQIPGAPPAVQRREIANFGAILTAEGGVEGNPLSRDPKMVGRLWRVNPVTGVDEYLQVIDGEVVFAGTSESQEQAFQWVSEACGNFGIMRQNPQHRLHLGPSPCDEGAPFGASLGNYIILSDPQTGQEIIITTEGGQLLVNGRRVRLEKKCPCHKKYDW